MDELGFQADWRAGQRVTLLQNGAELFPAMFAAIDAARYQVHLETYIFNLDASGLAMLDHLQDACRRGVRVRVLLDGVGSMRQIPELLSRFQAMGALCRVYRPEPQGIGWLRLSVRRLRRMHRKTLVVDHRTAFVGGINVLDDLGDVPDQGEAARPRFDFAVRLEGPIVTDISRAQRRLWLRMAWKRRDDWTMFYKRLVRWRDWLRKRSLLEQPVFDPGHRAILLLRDNLRNRRTIEDAYIRAIKQSRTDVLIANAYFFPGLRLRRALSDAARRGVKVRLLLQGRSEYPLQYEASRHRYTAMLEAGLELFEYKASYLHAKVAVIDHLAMVGSSNLDPFSLLLAREANVLIESQSFASELRQCLEREIAVNSAPVTGDRLIKLPWMTRMVDLVAYRLLRAGVALTGKSADY